MEETPQINSAVPEFKKGRGPLDAFLNLLSLITLGWMSISIGIILFQIINKFFGSKIFDYTNAFSQGSLKFGIASVIILTPIFLAVSSWLHHNYKIGKLNHKSGIHRWLTYLMLLVSALTIIGRLIFQLFHFLDGDYALPVILKTLVILIIAGGIFGYYLYNLIRKDFSRRSIVSVVAFILVVIVALASVVGAFFVVDPPAKARALKFDQERSNDLSNLSSVVFNNYNDNKKLPDDLSAAPFNNFHDPETNQPYEYLALSTDQYQLCATFSLPVEKNEQDMMPGMDNWYYHGGGRQCFTKSVQLPKSLGPEAAVK